MAHLTGSLRLLFFQCANYCGERGKTVIYCILVEQTAKLKSIRKEIMFHVKSKSDKRCNSQGSTKITRLLLGTLFFMRMVSLYLTPPLLLLLLPTCPLGPWISQPCFPCLSRYFFHLHLPKMLPLPSHLTHPLHCSSQLLWFSTGEKTEPSGMLLLLQRTEWSGDPRWLSLGSLSAFFFSFCRNLLKQ